MSEDDRVTIMINPKINKLLREDQAAEIKKTQKSISFSRMINKKLAKIYGVKI